MLQQFLDPEPTAMTLPGDTAQPTGSIVGGRYLIGRQLGTGAFGSTFIAHDRSLDRQVAVKVLDQRAATDWKAHELFKREADVLRGLRHHGVPEVFELVRDTWRGNPADFLVMEYIDGVSLQQLIDEKRPTPGPEVVHLFVELLGVLDYLHRCVPPILHRDIKPANIVVRNDGEPALVDFGSVRRETLGPGEPGSTIAGTYGYMPYEQYMGQAAPSSDLYALGATFLHLMTGRPPRDWMTDEGVIEVPVTLGGDSRMGPVLRRMLERSPTDRFPSAHAVRQAMWNDRAAPAMGALVRADAPRGSALDLAALGPVPRAIEGPTAALLDRVAPTPWQLADSSTKVHEGPSALDLLWAAFFSLVTLGIVPMIFISLASQRRRRLRRFFEAGLPLTAEVIGIQPQPTHLGEKLSRVAYQFEADGRLRRDTDLVLPVVAAKWMAGDHVQILYLPEQDYDSVIISTD